MYTNKERINVLNYLKLHDVEGTQKENYIRILDYMELKKELCNK